MSSFSTNLAVVITTIQEPTTCVEQLVNKLSSTGSTLISIGDKKGPSRFPIEGAEFFPLDDQWEMPFRMARLLPTGHYARKNLGYLLAASRGVGCVYETDDDNAPSDAWHIRSRSVSAQAVGQRPWLNVFKLFTDKLIWPRGFPLDRIRDAETYHHDPNQALVSFEAPIQQGLADNAPDVDAAWRLILDHPFTFDKGPSVWLPPGTWCPFNSQSTWWWPEAYALMYLPSYCTFRMTDIWRSFIAQRCLWEMGYGMVFHAAEVIQERNVHNLMRDFKDEVPGYLGNDQLVSVLNGLSLEEGVDAAPHNLQQCYEALVEAGFFPEKELQLVEAWCADLSQCKVLARAPQEQ